MHQKKHAVKPDHKESKNSQQWIPGSWVGTLGVMAIVGFFSISALPLEFGNIANPGPGLWPRSVSAVCGLLSILLLWVGKEQSDAFRSKGIAKILYASVALILVPALYDYFGVIPVAWLGTFILMRFAAEERWPISLIVSSIASVSIYGVFGLLLGVPIEGLNFPGT